MAERADVIHANNVLAHVPNLKDFIAGLSHMLKDDGTIIIEVPYLCELINKTAFDTIYHEHVFYFSLTALTRLFSFVGLTINDVESIPTHGGSLRLWITKHGIQGTSVRRMLSQESFYINAEGYYSDFAARVENVKTNMRDLLKDRPAVGFGAAAKATIFLNACGITSAQMAYVVDDTPTKQGKFIPGTSIPIYDSAYWLRFQPPYTMILAWNFSADIAHKYATTYHGRFFTWYTREAVSA